jgi:hypothetical protein
VYSNEITKNNNNYICTLIFNNVVLNHTIRWDEILIKNENNEMREKNERALKYQIH